MRRTETPSVALHQMRAAFGFIERNANIIKRFWAWELAWLSYSIANALAVTFIGAGMEQISGQKVDTQYLIMFLLVGTLVWHYLSMIFNLLSDTIAWERYFGTIEYTLMAPIYRATHLLGSMLFAVVYGLLHTIVILLVVVAFFDLDLSGANLPAAALVLLTGALSFVGLGMMGAVMPLISPERGIQMTQVVLAMLLLVSGVYYPTTVLPQWLWPVSRISPATHVLEGMREAILRGATISDLSGPLIRLAVLGVVSIPLGIAVFSLAERHAKRTGRLKRDG